MLALITVDTLTDEADGSIVDGDISLRDALVAAPASETIDFAAALDGGTILLTQGELVITKSISIDASSLRGGLTIDASGNDPTPNEKNGDGSRVFNIDDRNENTLSDVTLRGLTITGGDSSTNGGGIRSTEYLTVNASTIAGNSADNHGGGIFANQNLTVNSSTISRNGTRGFRDDSLSSGGGIYASSVFVNSSTITENGVTSYGVGGGISAGQATISNSIIAGNWYTKRGRDLLVDAGGLTLTYSLVGDNTGTDLAAAPVGMPDANGNLIGDPDGAGRIAPLLTPLADHGGPTKTHALSANSPAIDTGDPNLRDQEFDQRGAPFVRVFGNQIDMGAYERQSLDQLSLVVDTLADENAAGNLSLREALSLANGSVGADTITFDAALDGGAIVLSRGELEITDADALTIDAAPLTLGITIDASGNDPTPAINNGDGSRVFNINVGGTESDVTLSGLTLTGGDVDGNGGGIYASVQNGTVTISSSTISGNAAVGDGGGIYASFHYGRLTIVSSTISDNSGAGLTASSEGDAARFEVRITSSTISANSSAGITTPGQVSADNSVLGVRINNSTISGNSGPGVTVAGNAESNIGITSSTISGNSGWAASASSASSHGVAGVGVTSSTISGNGGGISARSSGYEGFAAVGITSSTISGNGGRISATTSGSIDSHASVTITSSTISGNSGGGGSATSTANSTVKITSSTISGNSGFGISASAGMSGLRTVTITSSTISGNTGAGVGTYVYDDGYVTIENSIVAGNSPDVAHIQTLTTVRFSIIGDDSNGEGMIDPLLGPLSDNGGPMQTHALLPGSPAINAGDPNFSGPTSHDQRGRPFVRISGGRIDMGAFESQIAPVDFNDDEQLDCADVDALVAAIADGDNPPKFDLTADEIVDQADLGVWLSLGGLENLASHAAYPRGDANLDGSVDVNDLNVVGLNWLQNVTGWCSGDFSTDGVVNAADLNKIGLNWLRDVSGVVAANRHVPRAALPNRVVAAIVDAPQDSLVLIAASEPTFSPNDRSVESATEYVSPSRFAKRYVRGHLMPSSARISSLTHDVQQSQEIVQEQLVDVV